MKTVRLVALLAVSLLVCREASAVKVAGTVTPANAKDVGFAVATEPGDNGRVKVTVTRDLSKAKSFDAASELRVVRSASLEVFGSNEKAGVIVQCDLEPAEAEGAVVYRFQIAPEHLARARLTVSEIDDYKAHLRREHLIGGGTILTLNVGEFVKP